MYNLSTPPILPQKNSYYTNNHFITHSEVLFTPIYEQFAHLEVLFTPIYERFAHLNVLFTPIYERFAHLNVLFTHIYEQIAHLNVFFTHIYEQIAHLNVLFTGKKGFQRYDEGKRQSNEAMVVPILHKNS